jgi:hypothetical protein
MVCGLLPFVFMVLRYRMQMSKGIEVLRIAWICEDYVYQLKSLKYSFAMYLNLGDTRTPWRVSVNPQVFLGVSANICNFAMVNTFNILGL